MLQLPGLKSMESDAHHPDQMAKGDGTKLQKQRAIGNSSCLITMWHFGAPSIRSWHRDITRQWCSTSATSRCLLHKQRDKKCWSSWFDEIHATSGKCPPQLLGDQLKSPCHHPVSHPDISMCVIRMCVMNGKSVVLVITFGHIHWKRVLKQ